MNKIPPLPRSPCYGCLRKNYAAGCENGCTEKRDWLVLRDKRDKAKHIAVEVYDFFASGVKRQSRRPIKKR